MDCRAPDTHPRPTIRWYKYGHPLEDITYRTVTTKPDPTTWILEFGNLLLADGGKYSCSVAYHGNSSGSVDRVFTLDVRGITLLSLSLSSSPLLLWISIVVEVEVVVVAVVVVVVAVVVVVVVVEVVVVVIVAVVVVLVIVAVVVVVSSSINSSCSSSCC